MALFEELVKSGFSEEAVEKLCSNERFLRLHRNKSAEEIKALIKKISENYGVGEEEIRKVITSFPPFAGLDHERVLKVVQEAYGVDESKAAKTVLGFPPFACYDHERVLGDVQKIYGVGRGAAVSAVLSFPPFAGLDHERVIRNFSNSFGRYFNLSQEEVRRRIIFEPRIAGNSLRRLQSFLQILEMPSLRKIAAAHGIQYTHEQLRDWVLAARGRLIPSPYVSLRYPGGRVVKATLERALQEMRARRARLEGKPTFLEGFRRYLGIRRQLGRLRRR